MPESFVERAARLSKLEEAVKNVLNQRFDDICWLDTYKMLGELVGVKFEPKLLPECIFLQNCKKFHGSMTSGSDYKTPSIKMPNGQRAVVVVDATGGWTVIGEENLRFFLHRAGVVPIDDIMKFVEDEYRLEQAQTKEAT